MALKDIWKDKTNDDSFINADDINNIARAVIDLENNQSENPPSENGATFIPCVSSDGVISWTNDRGLQNPDPVSIKGEKGDKGDKGEQGEKGADGHNGKDGIDGKNGLNGEDGYTPIRGTDYWTDEDKAEIKGYVDEAILGGAW